jgi:hypothetical protein
MCNIRVLQTNQCHMATCCKEAILLCRYPTNEEPSMSLFHIQDRWIFDRASWYRMEIFYNQPLLICAMYASIQSVRKPDTAYIQCPPEDERCDARNM